MPAHYAGKVQSNAGDQRAPARLARCQSARAPDATLGRS